MIVDIPRDKTAATAVEYGLVVAVPSHAVAAGVGTFAEAFKTMFGHFTSVIDEPNP